MKLNPEFQRNLWLELSPHRLVLIGGFLAALFIVVWQAPGSLAETFVGARANMFSGRVLAMVSMFMFILIGIAWGGYQAGESILDELRSRTWDGQRMSALGPWQMTWGKLFGATILSWFGGLICILVYLFARAHTGSLPVKIAVTCIAMAVLVQSINLNIAMVSTRLVKQIKGAHGLLTTLVSLAAIWYAYKSFGGGSESVFWYGQSAPAVDFLMVSVVVFASWCLFGLYRMMCTELKLATVPWAWALFLLYLAFYIGGTLINYDTDTGAVLSAISAVGFSISVAATYLTILIDFQDRLVLRRISTYIRGGQWRRAFQEIPLWCVSLVFAAVFALLTSLLGSDFSIAAGPLLPLGVSSIGIWLLTLRNVLILLFFSYGAQVNKPILTTLIYILLLDLLVPGLLNLSGFGKISWVLSPPLNEQPLLSAIVVMVHITIIGSLCWQRYQRNVAPR